MTQENPMTKRETALVIALAATIIVAAIVVLVATYTIHTTGKIKGIGVTVSWDPAGTQPCTAIDWGVLGPGDLAGVTVYIKNVKNTNATLSIARNNTQPSEFLTYSTLSWNYSGQVLHPTETICTQLTLLVNPNISNITQFSFDIIITATEQTS